MLRKIHQCKQSKKDFARRRSISSRALLPLAPTMESNDADVRRARTLEYFIGPQVAGRPPISFEAGNGSRYSGEHIATPSSV